MYMYVCMYNMCTSFEMRPNWSVCVCGVFLERNAPSSRLSSTTLVDREMRLVRPARIRRFGKKYFGVHRQIDNNNVCVGVRGKIDGERERERT